MKLVPSLMITLSSLISMNSFANTPDFAHISTTGYGEVVATPDMATFSVKVVESTMTAEQAKQAVDNVVESFLARLKEAGVKATDINSSNLYLAPQYHYPKEGKPELVGYRASRNVTVQVSQLANLNQYLDIALGEGINQVDNIKLKVKDEARYKAEARLAAINDASDKAKFLAEGFKRDLGSVWQINYNRPQSQPMLMRSMAMDGGAESNSYQDATLIIRDSVDVIYKID
ncbi:oxidative stress defense protein [Vibrio clamense]|uniref:oxidative stress defense protein n=1 Tax=Vibrio clamense TaxID=2910254 RepID=UPI003D21DE0A